MSDQKRYLNKETVLEAISISNLIIDEKLLGKQLSKKEKGAANREKYHSIIKPQIDLFRSTHNGNTPNRLLKLFLDHFLSQKGYSEKFEVKAFPYYGQVVNSHVWGAITKKDGSIQSGKTSYYPQLYISISNLNIHFGFCYGHRVKEDDKSVLLVKTDDEIKQNIINLSNKNKEIHFFSSYDQFNQSNNQEIKFNSFDDFEKKWTKDVHIFTIVNKNEINDNIETTIINTLENLFELFLKISEIDLIELNPTPKVVPNKKQVIFYGPPGTGKTYNSIIRAHEIIFSISDNSITYPILQEKLRAKSKPDLDITQVSSWRNAIMLAFHEIKKDKIQVNEIKDSKIIHEYSSMRNNHSIRNTIWYTLQAATRLDSVTVKQKYKTGDEFFDKDGESNWYLTEKGKEYLNALIEDFQEAPATSSSQFTFVTFHQSYSYEDFVEGIRPSLDDADGSQITYKVKDGIFKEICKKADLDPDNNYVLVIDEINRGNISKIFGELITLLEDNKRSGEKEAITVRLPYSSMEFSVPNNVYIIGTMNSTDKSIALVDVALRRRFHFERMNTNYDLIQNEDAKIFLEGLNGIICALKNPDYEIGHSYFINIPENDESNLELKKVFETRILPLIEEYFLNDWEALATILSPDSIHIEKRKQIVWDEDSGEFKKESEEYDRISSRCIDYSKDIFENTRKNLEKQRNSQEITE